MRAANILFRRELAAYFLSPVGYVIAAIMLLICGVLFQSQALGNGAKLSADVLSMFFNVCSITTMIAGLALTVWQLTEERSQHTIVLLNTSPVRDYEIILGKFLAAFVFLTFITLLSIYMPLLIMVRGKISFAQVAVGYTGLLLAGGTTLAIGLFASSLSRHLLVSIVVGACITGIMVLLFPLAKNMESPIKDVLQNLDLWWIHFQQGFMRGILNLKDVVFYVGMIYFFLLLATKTLEAKRWQ
jgi:ABC-2 type transport system permease protein